MHALVSACVCVCVCVWINSTWQRLSTSSEAVGFSSEIYAWTFQFLSYFTEKSQNRVDNTFLHWMILCARSVRDVSYATVAYSMCVRYIAAAH